MKKKLLLGLVSASLAASLCVGFSACQLLDPRKGEEFPADSFDQKWEEAFSLNNFTNFQVVSKSHLTTKFEGKTLQDDSTYTLTVADDLVHLTFESKASDGKYSFEYYHDGEVYYVKDDSGKWVKTDSLGDSLPLQLTYEDFMETTMNQYYEMKDEVEYDASKGGYVISIMGVPTVLKFRNGKLESVTSNGSFEIEGETEIVSGSVYFTYGGQKVTLPTVSE